MEITIDSLRSLSFDALETIYPPEHASLMTEIMLYAQEANIPSHGVIRMVIDGYGMLYDHPDQPPEVQKRTTLSRRIEGHGNPGMLVGGLALQELRRSVKEHDIGLVATSGSWSSSGALSYYLESMAREGYVVVMLSQSVPGVVPFGGVKAMYGTNPIGVGLPMGDADPILLDMATAITTYGDLARADLAGETLPEGIAFDQHGTPTTDPHAAMHGGGVAPFDRGYKGSHLGMMVEFLGGLMAGASFLGIRHDEAGWGNLLLAFRPELLIDADAYRVRLQEWTEKVNQAGLRLPGAQTIANRRQAHERGTVTVEQKVIDQIRAHLQL